MQATLWRKFSPALAAIAAGVTLAVWLQLPPALAVKERVPGTDVVAGTTTTSAPASQAAFFGGKLVAGPGKAAALEGDWPWFRGKELDGISHEATALARTWGPEGPPKLWGLDVGEGHAGVAVHGGRVYLLDYDRARQNDVVRCLSLADGAEIWHFGYRVEIKRNHGMSRTVPAVADDCVVTLGPKCHVLCADALTGNPLWAIDLVKEYKTVIPPWYAGQCPLIDRGRVILAPGGTALVLAADLKTGEIVWQTPNDLGWGMTHVSLAPMEVGGRRMYVYSGSGGVAGVSADDGRVLWQTPDWKIPIAAVATPVVLPGGRLFLSGGYDAGCMMIQIVAEGDKYSVKTLWRLGPKDFGATQHTPIYYKEHLYGVRPNGELACLGEDGKVLWTSGTEAEHKFGIGPFLVADGLIYVMNDAGVLTLAEAVPDGYHQLAQAKVLDGHDSWAPMALAGGRLILRDLTKMVCLDVKAP